MHRRHTPSLTLGLALLALLVLGCDVHLGPLEGANGASGSHARAAVAGDVWIYSSIYQGVIESLNPLIKEKYPDLNVRWYRAGSEVVARRLDTELRAGGSQADIVMTSDPFWYTRLSKEGRLYPYVTPDVLPIPRNYLHEGGDFATVRVSTMVIAYHPDMIEDGEVPRSFKALIEDRYKGLVTLGDPLASGTHFTTLAFLQDRYGWDYYRALRRQGVVANGGNSSVMRRIEGKEYPIGLVLLENVLMNQAKGSPIKYVIPEDGAITIPGNIAILKSTDNKAASEAIYGLMMSPEGQRAMVKGLMHSANSRIAGPAGTPSFAKLTEGEFVWTPEFTDKVQASAPNIKSTFADIMRE